MKIATWNLERLKKSTSKNQTIVDCLININADIFILTETNEIINLGDAYNCFHTSKLEEPFYSKGEEELVFIPNTILLKTLKRLELIHQFV